MKKILIVDDEKLTVRDRTKIILNSYEDINVVGDVSNGYEALEFCKSNNVDLVVMDIRMEHL